MARQMRSEVLEQIKLHAVAHLSPTQAQKTNLSFNRRVFEAGEQIGPPTQRVTLDEPAQWARFGRR